MEALDNGVLDQLYSVSMFKALDDRSLTEDGEVKALGAASSLVTGHTAEQAGV